MKVTVAVACYNLENFISKCLDSVVRQDYADMEIIVVDDCSTDNSREVINNFVAEHPEREIRLICHQKNQGISQNRNTSIEAAKGDSIFFIDGDDTIETNTITMLYRKMLEADADLVCSSFRMVDVEGETIREYEYPEDTVKADFAVARYIEKHVSGYFPMFVHMKLYRLQFLKDNHILLMPNLRGVCEDHVFTFEVAWKVRRIAFLHTVLYNWTQHPMSLSHRTDQIIYGWAKKSKEVLLDRYADLRTAVKKMDIPTGAYWLLNTMLLTDGTLRHMLSSDVTDKEKNSFLRELKMRYAENHIGWNEVPGIYNRLSYLILISPFPYPLFQFYFRHLKTIVWLVKHTRLFAR